MLFNSFGTIASQAGGVIPPAFVSAATSTDGTKVITTFSKEMADPSGKHAQFTVMFPSSASPYQAWSGYPDSPDLTSVWPYQLIREDDGFVYLHLGTTPFYYNSGMTAAYNASASKRWYYYGGIWTDGTNSNAGQGFAVDTMYEANNPVYTDNALAAIAFAKTTSDIAQNIVTAATLNATTTKIDLALTTAVTVGQTVTVAYTAGTVTSADTGILASFAAQEVTNNVAPPAVLYQEWSGYPDSPLLTTEYLYQVIIGANNYLLLSPTPFFTSGTQFRTASASKFYVLSSGAWSFLSNVSANSDIDYASSITQASNDVYTDATLTTVWKAKTTP